MDTATLSLGAALVAGLAASGHCAAMCGGIAGALAMRDRDSRSAARDSPTCSPTTCRASRATRSPARWRRSLGGALLHAIDVAALSVAFRVLSGLIMLAAAGRLLFGWRLLDPLEAAGSRLWRRVAPLARHRQRTRADSGRDRPRPRLGLAALRHDVLDAAARRDHGEQRRSGAAVMARLRRGHAAVDGDRRRRVRRVARALSTRASLKGVAGVLLLLFGAWTAGFAIYLAMQPASGHAQHMPAGAPAGHEHHHGE